ncbi:MAG: DNA helicase RecQ [Alphaproteobacteria bacterium]|nr:DNA helicase RecQ [Alphaproteobacteria bacterium]
MPDPLEVLRRVFGFEAFRGHQRAAIDAVVRGEDALVLMPTGAGKSLCYQVPALVRPGAAVVVSPLIALMQDQVAALVQNGVRAAALNSAMVGRERGQVERALRKGRLDLVYVAPERFAAPGFLDMLDGAPLALFAIDEAHCVSQWGHDFRPDYRRLAVLAERFPGVPRIALTATADAETRADIARELRLEEAQRFVSGFDRPNIRYTVKPRRERIRQLLAFLAGRRGEAGIVYCMTRNRVEKVAEELNRAGVPALAYHAGMEAGERAGAQARFVASDDGVMVATVAFGMGIDKPDVRFVAHLDLPKSLEAYYQETGRAGRDGLPAEAWMLHGPGDAAQLGRFIDESEAPDEQKRVERAKLEALIGYAEAATCRRRILLGYFGDECEPCGNCDICLDPPELFDGTEAAQMALSAIYRTGQRFGGGHIVDVLRGRETERVQRLRHDRLPTFGVGRERRVSEWRSIIRQLTAAELVVVERLESFSVLRLGPEARAVLRGERKVQLRLEKREPRPARQGRERRERGPAGTAADREGFEALRALRRELAQGKPPYVVFHDSVLIAMLDRRPATLEEMAEVPGVGAAKLRSYGAAFLEALRALPPPAED